MGTSGWGPWALQLFEAMTQPVREGADDAVGAGFVRLAAGATGLTAYVMSLNHDERVLLEGLEPHLVLLEETEGFRKTDAIALLLHRMALRLERAQSMGLALRPDASADAVRKFVALMREPPLPDAAADQARLLEEMGRRGIEGVDLLSKLALLPDPGMEPSTRLLLTLMSGQAAAIEDAALAGWAVNWQRLVGSWGTPDLVAHLHVIAEGPRLEALQTAFLKAMTPSDLVAWRSVLESRGARLAAQLVQHARPEERTAVEAELTRLTRLLDKATRLAPKEALEAQAARRAAAAEEQRVAQAQQESTALVADPVAFLKKMSGEREQTYYERALAQCTDGFATLLHEHVAVARLVLQALQAHLRPVAELPWRPAVAERALEGLATRAVVERLLEIAARPARPEDRDHARAAVGYLGERAIPLLAAKLNDDGESDTGQVAAALVRDQAAAAEPWFAARLGELGARPAFLRVGLELIAAGKRAERFELASRLVAHAGPGVREAALRAVAALEPAKALSLVRRYVGDRDVNLARTAILLLGEMRTQDPSVVQQFLDVIKRRPVEVIEPDERLQVATAQALGLMGNVLLRTGRSVEEHVLEAIQVQERKLLGLAGANKLRDKSAPVRTALCEALGALGGEKSLDLLRRLALSDPDEGLKAKAREAVRLINSRGGKPVAR